MFHSGWQQPRPLSILNLCRILKEAELPSLPHQTDHSPALFSALPHGFPCKAGSPHSLKAKPLCLPLSLLISPPSYQTPGEQCCRCPGACRSPGLVLEGREQCGTPSGSEQVAFLHLLCRRCHQAPVSLSDVCGNDGPYMTSSSFTVPKPTGFTSFPVPATFPLDMHIPSRCLIHSPELIWSQDRSVVETQWLENP